MNGAIQLITFALHNLCTHPDYVDPLRDEASQMQNQSFSSWSKEDLPLLDSFLKEVARLNPLRSGESFSKRRP